MLTTDAALICCSSRVWGAASASPARWMIASTDPVASSTPNSSRASSVVSRRETRLRTASVTTAACSRGPNAERGTLAGSSARVAAAHSGQQTRCSRCSLTRTAIGGNSATWCRDGSAASTRSARRTRARRTGSAPANARRPRRPARAEAAAGACPRARAGRPASDPTASRPAAAAPTADPATAAATSSANSGSAAARARPPAPRAARSPRPAPHTATNNATAVSRSPSRIASASARSTPTHSPPGPRSLPRLNAYYGRYRARTCDPLLVRQVLSQLS